MDINLFKGLRIGYFRLFVEFQQHPLIMTVKTEKRDGSTTNNPYVAFRRRTEKMQTRKVMCYSESTVTCLAVFQLRSDNRDNLGINH